MKRYIVVLCVLCAGSALVYAQAPQLPRFQSSVEVTTIDVNVVDDKGRPITTLTPADFAVRVDGKARRVVSADWVRLDADANATPPPEAPEGYSTNEGATGGRLIVIAVDEPNIRFGGAQAIGRAADAFVDRLSPSDRIAIAGFGPGAPSTPFTADHARVKQAIGRMVGLKQARSAAASEYNIAVTEAIAIDHGDGAVLDGVQTRECSNPGDSPAMREACRTSVEMQARTMAIDARGDTDETVNSLRALLIGLAGVEGPKTLILISEGFVLDDPGLVAGLGGLAAAARTTLYALKLDSGLFDITAARAPVDAFGDRQALSDGLETLAAAARGALFNVTGTGSALFDRIGTELSGYYQIAVESDPGDRDGKAHPIRVDVSRRGVIVRSRRQMMTAAASTARSPHQAVAAALASPLIVSALPLRVASFALQGPEKDRVQILIHADIGSDYAASRVVSAAYVITDSNGRMVDNKAFDARLLPVLSGVPSALQYTTGASLPPGDYTLKLAVVEGERSGTIEHVIHAALPPAGDGLALSELMVGGPVETGELLQPTIGYQVTFGSVHGYVEAYGSAAGTLEVEYEIATDLTSPALVDVDVPPHPAGPERVIFSRVVPVRQIPPGKYVLRAVFSRDGRSVRTLARGFEIAAPKVLMTSAEGLGSSAPADTGLFLPVEDAAMAPPFRSEDATAAETLQPFLARVTPAVKSAFDEGVASLSAGDYAQAEAAFKRAIDPDVDSTPALAYLAASFAAAGHDMEAASAWQTALVDGTEFPEIYRWLADALMRTHDYGQARAILEEAAGKWPSDIRFVKPLALMYATFGRGREAVRALARYLSERPDDRDAYFLGVQWIYTLHSAGAVAQSRTQDLQLAHACADAYTRANGPQAALVRQWIDYLDKDKR